MPVLPTPLFKPVYRNVLKEELNDLNHRVVNAYLDEAGASVGFPGYQEIISIDSDSGNQYTAPTRGLFWWPDADVGEALVGQLISVCNGHVHAHRFDPSSGWESNQLTSDGSPVMETDGRVSFAIGFTEAFVQTLFMANGGAMYTYDGDWDSPTFAAVGGSAPTSVVSLAGIDGYILAVESDTNRFWHSDALDPSTWESISYFSAAGSADDVIGVYVKNREIYILGTRTVEIWQNDGVTPFIRATTGGGLIEHGSSAISSVIVRDEGLYWLSEERRVVRFDGRTVTAISTPFDKEIELKESVSSCLGDQFRLDGKTFLSFNFVNDQSLVYCIETSSWSEQGLYDGDDDVYNFLPIHNHVYIPSLGRLLCADLTEGAIHGISRDYTDFNGEVIRTLRRTGHIDYGIEKNKRSNRFYFKAVRGKSTGTEPYVAVRFRDNNKKWSNWKEFGLGLSGDARLLLERRRNGIFHTRQYEMVTYDVGNTAFFDAKEDVEVLLR